MLGATAAAMRRFVPLPVFWAFSLRLPGAYVRRELNRSSSDWDPVKLADGGVRGNESWNDSWTTNETGYVVGPQGSASGEVANPLWGLCSASFVHRPGLPGSIVFVKTYKTGGSSWGGVMRRVGCRHGYGGVFENNAQRPLAGPHAVFANHITRAVLDNRVSVAARSGSWVTILRGPAERCMSWVYYRLSQRKGVALDSAALEQQKLFYMQAPECRNFQTKQLQRFGGQTPEQVLAAYDFVALTERFDESLVLLKHLWGLTLVDLLYLRSKDPETGSMARSYTHKPIDQETPRVQQAYANLGAANALDQRLHALAGAKLDRRKAAIPGFAAEVKRFQGMLREAEEACRDEWKVGRECMWGDNGCAQPCINRLAAQRGW